MKCPKCKNNIKPRRQYIFDLPTLMPVFHDRYYYAYQNFYLCKCGYYEFKPNKEILTEEQMKELCEISKGKLNPRRTSFYITGVKEPCDPELFRDLRGCNGTNPFRRKKKE